MPEGGTNVGRLRKDGARSKAPLALRRAEALIPLSRRKRRLPGVQGCRDRVCRVAPGRNGVASPRTQAS